MDAPKPSDPPPPVYNDTQQYRHQGLPVDNPPQVHYTIPQGIIQPPVSSPDTRNPHRSLSLFIFGIIDLVISGILFLCSFEVGYFYPSFATVYLGLSCAIFHVILGVVSIFAGKDVIRYRGCVIASLVMGIAGPCTFVIATIVADFVEWGSYDFFFDFEQSSLTIFLPILIFSILQGIVSIVISSLACCKICGCCGFYPNVETGRGGVPAYVRLPEN